LHRLQIKVANIDAATGKYKGDYQVYALCGFIRKKVRFADCLLSSGAHAIPAHFHSHIYFQGEADLALTELVRKADGN
jgi:hypothetical protein